MSDRFQYGGQAVIEGVMMRGRRSLAIAVRRPDKEIVVDTRPMGSLSRRYRLLRLPLIRGVVMLIESLVVGMQALMYSANQVFEDEEELSPLELAGTLVLALGLFVVLFIVAPNLFATWLQGALAGRVVLANLAEGILRILIFLLYVLGISRIKDIQRVFEYHGAEHKVIHTYEHGSDLTVENARTFSTLHPRCGTNFLLIVMIVSVLVFSALGKQTLLMRIVSRIVLLPVVAGVSYEVMKVAAHPRLSKYIGWMSYPGLMLQKLTTREPDDSQLEVAIRALNTVLASDTEKVVAVR
ncbi:MAG: DUF1385 domain-containing protein [Firmicutes bacterium]|nr:DUF1385 domain-containing protein [Bacillota bacterium]